MDCAYCGRGEAENYCVDCGRVHCDGCTIKLKFALIGIIGENRDEGGRINSRCDYVRYGDDCYVRVHTMHPHEPFSPRS